MHISLETINATLTTITMVLSAVLTLIGVLIRAKIIKGGQVKKLVKFLDQGYQITDALSHVRLTQADVRKIEAKGAKLAAKK